MAKIDWRLAKEYYLEDSSRSLADVAKKFGVSKRVTEEHASKEGWAEVRQSIGEKAFEQFQNRLLKAKDNAQDQHLTSFQNMRALANKAILDLHATGDFERDRSGRLLFFKDSKGVEKPIPTKLNPFELEKLAKALQIAINGERVVLGLPTSVNSITDPEGNDVFKGLFDMIAAAHEDDNATARKNPSS